MVLESLINPVKASKKPWEAFFLGMIYASMAVITSISIFKQYSSLVMISLTAIASTPLIYGVIRLEEKKDLEIDREIILIKQHGRVLLFFVFLFLGFVAAFNLWYVFLPADTVSSLFEIQLSTFSSMNSHTTGRFIDMSSNFGVIFLNNIKVLFFCLLFSFFYGVGAIFILTWNASILAALTGSFIRNSSNSFMVAPLVLLKYALHGIPEITAYFMGALAGGIISIAVVRHDFGSKKFKHILTDSFDLIILAVVILLIAALLEIFVSPLIF